MRYCDICKINPALLGHRDIHMCFMCAVARGWFWCMGCGIPHHPSTSHSYINNRYCKTCWDTNKKSCSECSEVFYGSLYDGMCNKCRLSESFSHPVRNVCDSYVQVQSKRYYGIELETHKCDNYRSLSKNKCWGAKEDDSIKGMEFDSPKFRGDCGFEAVANICEFAKQNRWETNYNCGYHLHIDLSKECARNLRAVAYAYKLTKSVWKTLIDPDRISNTWCEHYSYETMDIEELKNTDDWKSFASCQARRHVWLNWASYDYYGTLEIRSHEGTLDSVAVCNWVNAHLTFVDWAIRVGENDVRKQLDGDVCIIFNKMNTIWHDSGCKDLGDYYAEKSTLELRELV